MAKLSNHGNQENGMLWLARPKSHIILGVGGGTALSEMWSEHGGKVVYSKKTGIPEGGRIDIGWQKIQEVYWKNQCLSWITPLLLLHCTLITSLFQG